jgi:hypothetical protein
LHLKTLKDHSPSAAAWLKLAAKECGLGKSRSYQLLALAEGHTSVEQMRADAKERVRRHRAGCPLRSGQNAPDEYRPPGPKTANKLAKETGHPVVASDGFIYFGLTPEEAKKGKDRRAMVYDVRDALDHLASIELTGEQFLNYARPWQLWTREESEVIKKALAWLTSLDTAWDRRVQTQASPQHCGEIQDNCLTEQADHAPEVARG